MGVRVQGEDGILPPLNLMLALHGLYMGTAVTVSEPNFMTGRETSFKEMTSGFCKQHTRNFVRDRDSLDQERTYNDFGEEFGV